MNREDAIAAIQSERAYQQQTFDDPPGDTVQAKIIQTAKLGEYLGKAQGAALAGNTNQYRRRLIQVAALALQGLESLDNSDTSGETLLDHVRRTA